MEKIRAAFASVGIRMRVGLFELDIDERIDFLPADC